MPKSSSSDAVTPDVAYVALGSNLGDRAAYLAQARERLARIPATRLIGESTIEETAPLGPIAQGPYLNQMVALETTLAPADLLAAMQDIERQLGRVRDQRWGPRTLDLDLVLMERQRSDDPRCRVPHPELVHRPFWLRELAELRSVSVE
jgi:2-amino-4-hydroxy-6-hydroxymethyldihydropteridine diphosphokinase